MQNFLDPELHLFKLKSELEQTKNNLFQSGLTINADETMTQQKSLAENLRVMQSVVKIDALACRLSLMAAAASKGVIMFSLVGTPTTASWPYWSLK